MTSIFDNNEFIVDEKVGMFKFSNNYKIYNNEGIQIGEVVQKLTGAQKLLRLVINKSVLPFHMEIKGMDNTIHASLSRGWTLWKSKISVKDVKQNEIAIIKQKLKLFKPEFIITDTNNTEIASINGDWKAWNFAIINNSGTIGGISKKWNGAIKEIFTTADKYFVRLTDTTISINHKTAILSTAIAVDMILKERKN